MSEWINVKDRLPEPDIDVLLYLGDEQWNSMAVGGKYKEGEGWYSITDGEYYVDCDTMPCYWMPLPEPPRENGNMLFASLEEVIDNA